MFSTLLGFCKEIDDHNSKNIMYELEHLKTSLESLIDEKNNKSLSIKNETDNINQIKDEISNQKVHNSTFHIYIYLTMVFYMKFMFIDEQA